MSTTRLLSIADYKDGHTTRKAWEVNAAVEAILSHLKTPEEAEVLGIGAGIEPTGYMLTSSVRRVFMTDLYADAGVWNGTAPSGVLANPGQYAPEGIDFNVRRLVVQHMDMRDLRYEDETFDAVFSSGSIEHLPAWDDIAQAASEIGRVLKPGGIAAISTEWKIDGDGDGWDGVKLFDDKALKRHLVKPSGLELVGGEELAVDDTTLATAWPLVDIVARNAWPTIEGVLTERGFTFTSIFVVLVKPAAQKADTVKRGKSKASSRN